MPNIKITQNDRNITLCAIDFKNVALPVCCWLQKCCSACVLLATKMLLCLCAVGYKNVALPVCCWLQKCCSACVLLATKMLLCLCAVGYKNVALPVCCWLQKCQSNVLCFLLLVYPLLHSHIISY